MSQPSAEPRRKKSLPPDAALEELIHDPSPETLKAAAGAPRLTEDLALSLLHRRDWPREALEELNRNASLLKQRKVRLAIVMHPRTPHHVSVPIIRHLYTFELMQVALFPGVAADVKRVAEETLIGRLASISSGERYALAKQSSGRVAASLLLDKGERIVQAALVNPQMTDALVVKALKLQEVTELLVAAVCRHEKWSRRNEIKIVLLSNEYTPFARVLQFAEELPVRAIKDVLHISRLSPNVKNYLNAL